MNAKRNQDHDYWTGKKKLWMWFLQPDVGDVKLSELMTFAYRVYQDEYDETPSILKVCRATGLSKQAIG